MQMVIRQSDRIACLPGHVGRGRSCDTYEHIFLKLDSSVTVLRSNRAVGFAWIWIGIVLTDTKSSPFLSPIMHHHLSSSSRNLTTCFNPVKVSCFAFCNDFLKLRILQSFAWIFPFCFISVSQCESLFGKLIRVSCRKYVRIRAYFRNHA